MAVSDGASSEDVAALVATAFRGFDSELAPILGRRRTSALYRRSLHLCRPGNPWLPTLEDNGSDIDAAALASTLSKRTSAEAALAGTQLLESFQALLTTLIGETLTERLLRPVWATLLSGSSARDTKS
ncbi:hypothetical protein [Rhizobacter sp. Root404]|uniref:hypothetical protein n=1 Tax=Rhizobacter sp. Root404 TaxID=1736528 RepID=UPI0012FB359D|nr:hypothetical protein [Rhizobacter sp. Root404]